MKTEPPIEPQASSTAVNFEHSTNFPEVLAELGLSLMISTYQAGKLITVGTHKGRLEIRFNQFEQAMGIARTPEGLAVGTKRQIWMLRGTTEIASRIEPMGRYDIAFLASQAHFTGPLQAHEMAYGSGELWFLNTLFSSICTLKPHFHFVPVWQPPFVTTLATEDRCHLNGMAMIADRPGYVTVLGESDTRQGWRENKATGGCLIDVRTSRIVWRGLSMPHSPRVHRGELFLLNSGYGQLNRLQLDQNVMDAIVELPGYTRGLDLAGRYAFVGLSKIRETSVFGGLPIADRRDELRCGVAIVDLDSRQTVSMLLFHSGIEEIFEVKTLPGFRNPFVSGPLPDADDTEPIWCVPQPKRASRFSE